MPLQLKYPKSLRLCGQMSVGLIMTQGKWLRAYPLSCKYLVTEGGAGRRGENLRFVLIAQKRKFRHAVDRNRCKRLMREAVRMQCQQLRNLCAEKGTVLHVALFYMGKTIEPLQVVSHAVEKLLAELEKQISS